MAYDYEAITAAEFGQAHAERRRLQGQEARLLVRHLQDGPGRGGGGVRRSRDAVHLRQVPDDLRHLGRPAETQGREGLRRHLDDDPLDDPGQPGHRVPQGIHLCRREGEEDGEVLIMAKDLVDYCMDAFGFKEYEILDEFPGEVWKDSRRNTPSSTGRASSSWPPSSLSTPARAWFTSPRATARRTTRSAWNTGSIIMRLSTRTAISRRTSTSSPGNSSSTPTGPLSRNSSKWGRCSAKAT